MTQSVTVEESDDVRVIGSPNARLTFRFRGGQWNHSLEVGSPGGWTRFFDSVESEPGRDDFRSLPGPVFQDLHIQEIPFGFVAMLVGQFGPRHFSATVEFTSLDDPGEPERGWRRSTNLVVDVAERTRDPAQALASTYAIADSIGVDPESYVREAVWSFGAPWHGIVVLSPDHSNVPNIQLTIETNGTDRVLARISRELLPFQANGRLAYSWHVVDSPDVPNDRETRKP